MLMEDKKVFVARFKSRNDRMREFGDAAKVSYDIDYSRLRLISALHQLVRQELARLLGHRRAP